MDGLGLALSDAIIGAGSGHALAAAVLGVLGLAGVTDWILGDDEAEVEGSAADGGDAAFDDVEGAAGAGSSDGEFAFDDGGGAFDDGSGGFDEFDVGEGGGGGEGGSGVADLERRVDDLADEVDQVSSTMSTVRSENEQISETVDDVEENVRKLLDIYKLVTKGVNPFVDSDGGESFSGDQTLGLFGEDEVEEEPAADLDDDLVDAEPDEFFDEDFEEDDQDMDQHQEADEPDGESDGGDETVHDGRAKSFDELREEYEEDPEWVAEEDEADGDADVAGPDLSIMDDRIDRVDEPMDETVAAALAAWPEDDGAGRGGRSAVAGYRDRRGREKPYLRAVPGGYVADLVVMEWVEFLVTVGGAEGAHRAITYYENVDWLDPDAADQLREFVEGHPEATGDVEDDGGDPLSMDHHTTSLRYIARLNGDVHENVLDAWDDGDNRWHHR